MYDVRHAQLDRDVTTHTIKHRQLAALVVSGFQVWVCVRVSRVQTIIAHRIFFYIKKNIICVTRFVRLGEVLCCIR